MNSAGSNSYRISHRETGIEYNLNAAKLTLKIGRDQAADIRLDNEKVSKRHAIFTFNTGNGNAYVEDLGSRNGTKVEGKLLQGEPRPLRSGEVVEIAGNHFDVTEVGGGPPIAAVAIDGTKPLAGIEDKVLDLLDRFPVIKVDSSKACLVVRNLEQAGRRIDLDLETDATGNKWTIGQDPAACRIHLPGGGVSRLHATISALPSSHGVRWRIMDEVAQNKLYVNQEQCTSKFLSDGDRIIFGDVLVQFVMPPQQHASGRRQSPGRTHSPGQTQSPGPTQSPARSWWQRLLDAIGLR